MYPINKFKIEEVSSSGNEAVFKIEPLAKGYGHTLGTIFRRVLLSSIPGAAITAIRLNGVQHEYTTIGGLQDDVLEIVLGLKNISVVSHSEDPVTLKLEAKGKKGDQVVVTAGDIEKDAMVEIVNPEQVITTLADSGASIDAEIVVEKGIGYTLPEEERRAEIGTIPVDARFSPVELVSLEVGRARVGQQTDLDSLQVKVVTNGAITPSAAVHQAAEILMSMTDHLVNNTRDLLSGKAVKQVEEAQLPVEDAVEEEVEESEDLMVSEMGLSTRLTNALVNQGYENLRSLDGMTEEEVANIEGIGDKSLQELMEVLKENDINLI